MKLEDDSHDVAIGAAVVTLLAALIGWAAGLHGLIYVAVLVPFGALVLFLWTRPSRWARALAIVLMPGILLIYLLPQKTRHAIAQKKPATRTGAGL